MWKLTFFISVAVVFHETIASAPYVNKLTKEQEQRLSSWTHEDKQNIWEVSGQFEGDMVLLPGQRNGLISTRYRWPKKEIPYEIASGFFTEEQEGWIQESLKAFEFATCVRTRLRTSEDEDYVRITGERSGCWSYIGRRGGRQDLNLQSGVVGQGCLRNGTVVHEFLHAFGFYHQHSDSDRDEYVHILWENIQAGAEKNFNKYGSSTISSFGFPYDYASLMHYGPYAFSSNRQPTIVAKDPEARIGQSIAMSEIDARKLSIMYEC